MLNINSESKKINEILNSGGVIAFVTDTVWGIGCLPENKTGVDKIYEIKGRDRSKPLILMSCDIKYLRPYVNNLSGVAERLVEKHFPGALTVISDKSDKTPSFCTSGKNTVGIRVPDNKFFSELCSVIDGHVLATTSANISGEPASTTYEQAQKSIGNLVDIIFDDAGYKCAGKESTVILTTADGIKILRQGAVIVDNILIN